MSYSSASAGRLYQLNPLPYRQQPYKLKAWTDTLAGYLNEADQVARCVLRNRRLKKWDYPWAVTINVEKVLTPAKAKSLWQKASRKLNARGVVALWVREPSRKNHVNYHLIVASRQSENELADAIEQAMPDRKEVRWHKQITPIKNQWSYARYVVKAKTPGNLDGKYVEDKFRNKRLMFKPNLDLRKLGTIGNFWVKPKKQLWDEIKAIEQRIAEGLQKPNVKRLARHVYGMLGEHVPLTRIERSFGFWSDAHSTRQWIEQLFGESAGEPFRQNDVAAKRLITRRVSRVSANRATV